MDTYLRYFQTSYTTIWTLYLLSKNKDVRQELFKRNSIINYAIKESMRLYPVAPFLTRILPKECIFGAYKLKGGVSNLFMKFYQYDFVVINLKRIN